MSINLSRVECKSGIRIDKESFYISINLSRVECKFKNFIDFRMNF